MTTLLVLTSVVSPTEGFPTVLTRIRIRRDMDGLDVTDEVTLTAETGGALTAFPFALQDGRARRTGLARAVYSG